jgi:mRNA interferase MazF
MVKRGEVYLVDFNPSVGSEIKKIRPGVVIQNNIGNEYSSNIIVAALSSHYDEQLRPTEVFVKLPEGGLDKSSVVLTDMIRTFDKCRLLKKLGVLKPETMSRVNRALAISLGLIEF